MNPTYLRYNMECKRCSKSMNSWRGIAIMDRLRPECRLDLDLNARGTLLDPEITAALNKLGLFESKGRRLETTQAHLIRRYVEMGFGIGLVAGSTAGVISVRASRVAAWPV